MRLNGGENACFSLLFSYHKYGSYPYRESVVLFPEPLTKLKLVFKMLSQPSHIFQSSDKALRTAYKDLKQDLKATRWRRGLGWSVGVIWFVGLLLSAILIGLLSTIVSYNTACLPDGSFRLQPDTYSIWSSSGFFQITLAGGNLNFVQAKVIDIAWDIVSRQYQRCVTRD